MTIICTYCSGNKKKTKGELPAIRRYKSQRIDKIYKLANLLAKNFFILSGEFGLIPSDYPIPYYDHLLKLEEVWEIIPKVIDQLNFAKIKNIIYFTESIIADKFIFPYYILINSACHIKSIPINVVEI